MAQTGFTPIQLYSTSTAAAAPVAGNLTNSTLGSELAINITDGKLFYKDNANAVQVIGWKVVPATAGGTGQTSYAVGDLLYADTTTSLAKLADVATGNALISGGVGVAPAWGKIGLTTHVSGTLPVANGGTGTATAFTAGSVVFAGASGTYSQDNAKLFWDDTNNLLGIGTATPADGVGFSSAIDIQSTVGGGIYLRDSDAPTTGMYLGYIGSNLTTYVWNISNGPILFGTNDAQRLSISATGLITISSGGGLSIAATGVTSPAAGDGNVFSGTYTPTQVSSNTNVDSVTFSANQYMRVGNTVTVSGQITIDATTANTDTTVKMSLPVASNFGASRQVGGTGSCISASNFGIQNIAFIGDATNDCVEMRLRPSVNTSLLYAYSFTYQVI